VQESNLTQKSFQIIKCEECGEVTEVKQNKFVCGNCGHPTRNIVQGEELYINEINFRKNE